MTTAGNWSSGTVPTATDVARWNAATYTRTPTAGVMTIGELLFGSGNTNGVTFNTGGSVITLNGISGVGIQVDAGSGAVNTANAGFTLGASQSWINNSSSLLSGTGAIATNGNTLTVSGSGATTLIGVISGSGGVAISNGTVTLSGGNTFTGGMALSSGTLVLGNNASLGGAASALTITGGSIDVTAARSTTNNNAQNWNGDFTYVGSNTWNTGTNTTVTLGGNRAVTVSASNLTVGGTITDGASSYSLTKNGNGTLTLQAANTFDGGVTLNVGTLVFNNAASLGSGTFTINGGTIDGNNVTIANAQVWNGDFTYGAAVNTLNLGTGAVTLTSDVRLTTNLNGVRTLTVGGVISGAHSLTKDGAGQLTLSGSSDFSGGLKILNGTLSAATTTGTNSMGTGAITLGDVSGTNSAKFTTANLVTLNNAFVIAAGSTGTLTIETTGNAAPFYSGTMSLNNDLTVSHAATTTTKTTTFSGPVVQDSTAHTITVGSTNTGGITFSGGIAVGTGGLTVAVSNGATSGLVAGGLLRVTGGVTSTTTGNLTLQNNSAVTDGIIISGSSVNNAGTITNSGTGTGSVTISSVIGSNVTGVTQGSATSLLTLSASNSYVGTTTVSSGSLQIGNARALGATTTGLAVNAGTLDLKGNSVTVGQLSGNSAAGVITSSTTTAVTLTSNSSSNSTYAGAITNGSGTVAFTKSGTGALTFTGSNTYTGATAVNAGTLVVNGFTGNSAVTVGSTATLSGTGRVGALTVLSGGTLAPGNSPGIINSGSFSLNSGATLAMEFTGSTGSPVAGTNNDQVNVTGGVTLGGDLSLTLTSYTQVAGSVFFLVSNDGIDLVNGVFANANFAPSTVFTLGGQQWQINYNADIASTTSGNFTSSLGNDVALLAVPEPSVCALVGLGAVALLWRRKSKRA